MKKIACLFIFLFCYSAFSQSLSVFNIDATSFPLVKANFYAFDGAGNQILNLSPSDFIIRENGLPRTVTNLSCPSPKPPKALSSVLVFDMSGSMHFGPPRIESAKLAANAWIDGLPLGKSECALVSFSDNSYIVHDFTTNMQLLKNSITLFSPTNGTNYNQALIDEPCGGLQVAKLGKHKRVVVFLTDGLPNFAPKTAEIIDFALKNQITIYAVTLDMKAPQCIKDLTQQTGGTYFENITTQKEAQETYLKLLEIAQGGDPCEIEWESKYGCQEGNTNISVQLKSPNLVSELEYPLPNITSADLEISPKNISLKNVIPGLKKEAKIKVTAYNANYNISNIICSNPAFTVQPTSFNLSNGQSKDLIVTFAPTDSGFTYAKLTFESNLCPVYFFVSGGFIGKKPKIPTLNLTSPNGYEKFCVGIDTLITWEGISTDDFVRLDYSIDYGYSWKTIADSANGSSYIWKNIPKPESNLCKVRVKQRKFVQQIGEPGKLQFSFNHKDYVNNADWSPDDSRIATACNDTTAVIWDAVTGKKLMVLQEHSLGVRNISWSADGSRLATLSLDNTVIIWDAITGEKQNLFKGYNNDIDEIVWSPDGERLAASSDNGSTIIWDVVTGTQLKLLITTLKSNRRVCWSPDGSKLASTQNEYSIIIWETNNWTKLDTLRTSSFVPGSISWSPDGRHILAISILKNVARVWDANFGDALFDIPDAKLASWSPDGNRLLVNGSEIWNAASGQQITALSSITGQIISAAWSPTGKLVASGGKDMIVRISDAASGKLLHSLKGHLSDINDLSWSSDGSRVISAGRDWSAKVWFADTINYQLQEDQSDEIFSIVLPKATANDLDMGKCLFGSAKDSLVHGYITNKGSYPLTIDSIYFTGPDANAFNVVSGIPQYNLIRNESKTTEFRFIPNKIGIHSATINILTQSDTLVHTIQGEGVLPQIEVLSQMLDFGEVELGNEKLIQDTVLIKNLSDNDITINNVVQLGPDKKQFQIIGDVNSFVLPPHTSKKFTIKFKPIYGGRTSGQLGFEYNGLGSPAKVDIFGIGKGGLVFITHDSSYAGDESAIKIQLGNIKPEAIASIANNFEATIRLQNTLLAPQDRSNSYIKNDSLFLNISGKIETSTEILQIPVIACLGNVEETTIDIIDFNLIDNTGNKIDYIFEKQSGIFKILGLCREGGTRLFNPTGKVEILQIIPNPAADDIEIKFNLIEEGNTTLSIYNSNGVKTKEFNLTGETGMKAIWLDGREYSNGLYLIQLQTPTILDNQKLMIIK